jgi:predicted RNA-binding protein with TRAM domain
MCTALSLHLGFAQVTSKSLFFPENRSFTGSRNWAIRQNNSAEGDFQIGFTGTNLAGLPDFYITPSDAKLTIKNTGDVGIGVTDTKGYRLAVGGKAVMEEVVVKLKAIWPDYVFKPSYKLRPLRDVKAYINEHGRLPELPSSEEVAEHGVSVGATEAILLKKVEELTLYILQQEERIKKLEDKLEQK